MSEIKAPISGTITLVNTQHYPFNNSQKTAALASSRDNPDYRVHTEVVSASGEVGDVIISDRAINGFKIAFTGSATQAVIRYWVSGGLVDETE
jgi:hypothetical protein